MKLKLEIEMMLKEICKLEMTFDEIEYELPLASEKEEEDDDE